MKLRTPRILFYAAFAFSVCGAISGYFIYVAGPFRFSSVCERCGAVRYTTEWQFPRTRWTVFKYSSESETSLSRVLITHGIVTGHNHAWVFAGGGGNGVKCALGRAFEVQSTVQSNAVAHIIEVLHEGGEHEFRDRVLTNLFGRDTSFFVRRMPQLGPAVGSLSKADLHRWVLEQSEYLDEAAANLR